MGRGRGRKEKAKGEADIFKAVLEMLNRTYLWQLICNLFCLISSGIYIFIQPGDTEKHKIVLRVSNKQTSPENCWRAGALNLQPVKVVHST